MGQNWRNPPKKKGKHGNKKKQHDDHHLVSSPRSSSSSSSSSSLLDKEIYYCVSDNNKLAWYSSSSSIGPDVVLPITGYNSMMPDICTLTSQIRAAVSVGSTIYAFVQHRPIHSRYYDSLYYLDTRNPVKGWISGPSTIAPRVSALLLHVYKGKIYVFGGSNDAASPYAECFDPNHPHRWVPFPGGSPPPQLLHAWIFPIDNSNNNNTDLFVHALDDSSALYQFSFVTESWRLLNDAFAASRQRESYHALCIVGDFLYQYFNLEIYAYDLISNTWLPNPIQGYRFYLGGKECPEPPPLKKLNGFPTITPPILKHIGNGELLMTWFCCHIEDSSMHIVTDIITIDVDQVRSKGGLASSTSLVANLKSRNISNMLYTDGFNLFQCLVI